VGGARPIPAPPRLPGKLFGMTQHHARAVPGRAAGAPALYGSSERYRRDLTRHQRRPAGPAEEYLRPATEAQRLGWARTKPSDRHGSFRHRSSELSNYNDAFDKQADGRSVRAEFSTYGSQRLLSQSSEARKLEARVVRSLVMPRYAQ